MFALVLWKESSETSVIPFDLLKKSKGTFSAKWGSSFYPIDLLRTSENKEWLESLEVTTDGEIITPSRRSSISSALIYKKRDYRYKEKAINAAKGVEAVEMNKKIMKKSPIFQDDLTEGVEKKRNLNIMPQTSDSDSESEASTNTEIDSNESDSGTDESSIDATEYIADENDQPQVIIENDYQKEEKEKEKAENKMKSDCICSQLCISVDDIEKLELILSIAKEIHIKKVKIVEQFADTEKPVEIAAQALKNEPVEGNSVSTETGIKVELFKEAGITVDNHKVKNIYQIYKKNPRELVRQLMKLIIGEEELKKSSAKGKNGWTPIPTDVFEAVLRFVNECAIRKKYKISHKKYREVLTAMCATLRSAAKKEDQGKAPKDEKKKPNEKKINFEDEEKQELNDQEKLKISNNNKTHKKRSHKRKSEKIGEPKENVKKVKI